MRVLGVPPFLPPVGRRVRRARDLSWRTDVSAGRRDLARGVAAAEGATVSTGGRQAGTQRTGDTAPPGSPRTRLRSSGEPQGSAVAEGGAPGLSISRATVAARCGPIWHADWYIQFLICSLTQDAYSYLCMGGPQPLRGARLWVRGPAGVSCFWYCLCRSSVARAMYMCPGRLRAQPRVGGVVAPKTREGW
jgi:hypothetical protein